MNNPNTTLSLGLILTTSGNQFFLAGPGYLELTNTVNQNLAGTARINIAGGVLRANHTQLGFTSSGTGQLNLVGGVLEIKNGSNGTGSSADFTRILGTGAGRVNWGAGTTAEQGSGGFSAYGSAASVNIRVDVLDPGDTPATLQWNRTNFVADGFALRFGSTKSDAVLTWLNPLQLDNGTAYQLREISVTAGAGGDMTVLAGTITGTAVADFIKTGTGTLVFGADNSYAGSTLIAAGTLQIGNGSTTGTLGTGVVTNNASLVFNRSDDISVSNLIGGTGSLTQSGTAKLTLSGVNIFTGAVSINNSGTLSYSAINNLGTGTSAIAISNGGTLQATTGFTDSRALSIGTGGGTFEVTTGTVTRTGGVSTNGNAFTFSGAGNTTISTLPITGTAGTLTKDGIGILTLSSGVSHTYSGVTTVSDGTMVVNGVLANSSAVNVNAGTLGGTGTIANTVTVASSAIVSPGMSTVGTLTVGGLTLNANSILNFDLAAVASSDQIVVTISGGLDLAGSGITFNLSNVGVPGSGGLYQVITYTGALSGLLSNITAPTLSGYNVVVQNSGSSIDLNITSLFVSKTWYGTVNGTWDVATTANWNTGPSVVFNNAEAAIFDDNGSAQPTVTLNTAVSPASVTFGNTTAVNYVLSGSGSITGTGGFTKNGTGSVTINTLNSFTGNVAINNGTVSVSVLADAGTDSALGKATTAISLGSVSTSATLIYTGGNVSINRGFNLGASGGVLDISTLTTTLTLSGIISGGGLTKAGPGVLLLSSTSNSFTGAITVSGGTLSVGDDANLGNTTNGITLRGATLRTTASFSSTRTITLSSGGTIDVVGATLTLSTGIDGTGALTKTGAGTLVLSGMSTFSGATNINGGILQLAIGNDRLPTGTSLTVDSLNSSEFDLNSFNQTVAVVNNGPNGGGLITNSAAATTSTFTVGSGNFSGSIADGAGVIALTKNTSGTLILNTANNYSGMTSLTNGIVTINHAGAIGTGAITFTGGTLQYGTGVTIDISTRLVTLDTGGGTIDTNGNNVTFANSIGNSGAGGLTKTGAGTLILGGSNSYAGTTVINQGILSISSDSNLGTGTSIQFGGGTLLTTGAISSTKTISTIVSTSNIIDNGGFNSQFGAMTLNGHLSFAGIGTVTTGAISGTTGNLVVGGNGNLIATGIYGTAATTGTLTISHGSTMTLNYLSGSSHIASGTIDGTLVLVNGIRLNFNNGTTAGTGQIQVQATGTLISNNSGNTGGTVSPAIVLNSTNIPFTPGDVTGVFVAGTFRTTIGGTNGGGLIINGIISGDSDVDFSNNSSSGGGGGYLVLNAQNTYTGATSFSSNNPGFTPPGFSAPVNVVIGIDNALPTTTNVIVGIKSGVAQPVFDLNGFNQQIGSLSDGPFVSPTKFLTITNRSTTSDSIFTINGSTNPLNGFGGIISDGPTNKISVVKNGSNVLKLSGVNTYTGTTTIDGGKLNITGALGATAVTVNSGGALGGAGDGTTTGIVGTGLGTGTAGTAVVNSGGKIDLIDSAIGIFTIKGNADGPGATTLTLNGGSILNFDVSNTAVDQLAVLQNLMYSGTVTINLNQLAGPALQPGVYTLISFNNDTGSTGTFFLTPPSGFSATLSQTSTAVLLNVTSPVYWKGDQSSVWNTVGGGGNTNWYADAAGTINTLAIPIATDDVFFAVTSGATNMFNSLGANTSIKSLTFTSVTDSVTIGGIHSLTIGTGGITNLSNNAQTILLNVVLGTDQTWSNNGSGLLSVNGATVTGTGFNLTVAGTGNTTINAAIQTTTGMLTKNGTGNLILNGVNTFTGNTLVNVGTLTVNGSLASGSTVDVATTGTLAGTGTINGNATVTGAGVINLGFGGSIGGTLGVTGGFWNGQGSVAGLTSVTSGTFTLGAGANMTATGGLNVSGSALLSGPASSSLTGSINYTSSGASTFAGNVFGSGTVTMNNSGGQLTLSGFNFYTGVTTITDGTLTLTNGAFGAGGTITLADSPTAILEAGGVITRNIVANGVGDQNGDNAPLNGTLRAISNLTVGSASAVFNFNGTVETQGNTLTIVSQVPPSFDSMTGAGIPYNSNSFTIRSAVLDAGGTLTSNGTIYMPDWQFGFGPGGTGIIYDNGSGNVTVRGNFFGGTAGGAGTLVLGFNGGTTTFTGIVYGNLSNIGENLVLSGSVQTGFSPVFSFHGGNFTQSASQQFIVYSNTQPTKILTGNSVPSMNFASNTLGSTVHLSYGTQANGLNPTVLFTGAITLNGDSGNVGTYSAVSGDTFYLVRTDSHLWPGATATPGLTWRDGNLTNTVIPSVSVASSLVKFNANGLNLFSSMVTGQGGFIRAWFGSSTANVGMLPQGSGTWAATGGGDWSNNPNTNTYGFNTTVGNYLTAVTGSWGAAGGVLDGTTGVFGIPKAAGDIATFDSVGGGGTVNQNVSGLTIGGIVLAGTSYSIGGAANNQITLDNGQSNSVIQVNSGTHTITSALNVTGAGLTLATTNNADVLTISGAITSSGTGNNASTNPATFGPGALAAGTSYYTNQPIALLKTGNGTLVLNGANTIAGLTTVSAGTLSGNGSISSGVGAAAIAVQVNAGAKIRGGVAGGTGTLTLTQSVAGTAVGALTINTISGNNSTIQTEVSRTGSNTGDASLISLTTDKKGVNLVQVSGGGKFVFEILDGASLLVGENYTFNLIQTSATGGTVSLNGAVRSANVVLDGGSAVGAGTVNANSILTITGNAAYSASVIDWSVHMDSTGHILQLTMTSTPEPHHIMLICVGVLLIGVGFRRYRLRKQAQAA